MRKIPSSEDLLVGSMLDRQSKAEHTSLTFIRFEDNLAALCHDNLLGEEEADACAVRTLLTSIFGTEKT